MDKARRTLIHITSEGARTVAVRTDGIWYLSFECTGGGGQVRLAQRSTRTGDLFTYDNPCGFRTLGPGREAGPAELRVIASGHQRWELLVQQPR